MPITIVRLLLALCAASVALPAVAQDDFEVRDPDRKKKIVERIQKLLERSPWNDYTFKQLQQHAPGVGGIDTIIEQYQARVAADPDDVTALVLLARLYYAKGQNDLALRYADQAEKAGETGWALYRLRGTVRSELGDVEAAEADFEIALDKATSTADKMDVLRELGDAARRQGRDADAIEIYKRIADLDPKDKYLRWELANLFFELAESQPGQDHLWDAAIEQFREAATLAGRNVEERSRAEMEIASIFTEKLERHQDAIVIYDAILDRTTDKHWMHREVRILLEDTYRRMGDLQGLLDRLDKILARRKNDSWALGLRPKVLNELGRADEALEAWERYLAKVKNPDPDAFGLYIQTLQRMGEQPKIIAAYEERIDKTRNQQDKVFLVRELVGHLRNSGGLPLEAYATLRAYEDEFDSADAQLELAKAYQSLGIHADIQIRASYLIEKVLDERPENMDAWLALLEVSVTAGNTQAEDETLTRIRGLSNYDESTLKVLVSFYEERARVDRVRELLADGVQRWPDDMDLRFMYAEYGEAGSPNQQMGIWRDVLLQSDNLDHLKTAALYYTDLIERFDIGADVVATLERQYAAAPEDWRRGRLLYFVYVEEGQLDDAELLLSTIEAWMPAGINLPEQALPMIAEREGRVDDALYMLRSMARHYPQRAWQYDLQSAELLLIHGGDAETSAALVERALADAPQNPEALLLAGDIYGRLGRWGDAEAVLEEGLQLAPRNNRIRLAYTRTMYQRWNETGEYPLLEAGYRSALEGLPWESDPDTVAELLNVAGQCAFSLDMAPAQIRADLEKAAAAAIRTQTADAIRDYMNLIPDMFAPPPVW